MSVTEQENKKLLYINTYTCTYRLFKGPISDEVNQTLPALAHFAYVPLTTLHSPEHSLDALSDYFYQHMLNQSSEPEPASDSEYDCTPPLTP